MWRERIRGEGRAGQGRAVPGFTERLVDRTK